MSNAAQTALLDRLADVVTGRPRLTLAAVVAVTALSGAFLYEPGIERDPTPEKLLASFEEDEALQDEFRATFQANDKVLVLLVRAEDVLAKAPLQYLHDLSAHFRDAPYIDRAQSLTLMPLPRNHEVEEESGLGDLEAELLGQDPAPEPTRDQTGISGNEDALQALSDLVDSEPDLFEDGYGGLLARLGGGGIRTNAIVQGAEVTDDEVAEMRDVVARSPLVQGRLVSADGTVAVVVLSLAGEEGAELDHAAVSAAVEQIRGHLADHPPPDGVQVLIGGLPYIRLSIVENMRRDQMTLIPATLVVCMFLLFLSFRWAPGVVLPILAAGLTVCITLGGMAITGEPMNVLNNIIPPLIIIIGITAAIHVIQRYREEARRVDDPVEARRRAVKAMGVALLLTSLTTAVGLGSLLASQTEMLRHFGVIAAGGVMVVYFVCITFLPAVMTWFKPPPSGKGKNRTELLEVLIVQLTRKVLRNSSLVLAGTVVLLGVLVWGAANVDVDHKLLDQFNDDSDVYTTTRLMEDELDGVRPLEVLFRSGAEGRMLDPEVIAAMDAVARWAGDRDEVLSTMSHSDLMRESLVLLAGAPELRERAFANRQQTVALRALLTQSDKSPISLFLSDDARTARLTIKVRDVGAKATLALIRELDGQIRARTDGLDGVTFGFAGDAYTGSRGLEAVIGDLMSSLLAAVGIIFVLLVLLFRSFRLALLSIPPYIIPLTGTMAYMYVRGIPLNATTVIIFSISIGLAVDGSIHVLQRFREETRRGLGTSVALLRSARGTGRAIAVSCFTLMAGFGVLMLSEFVPVRNFGELIAVTIGSCLLSTIVIQPALLRAAGVKRAPSPAQATAAPASAEE